MPTRLVPYIQWLYGNSCMSTLHSQCNLIGSLDGYGIVRNVDCRAGDLSQSQYTVSSPEICADLCDNNPHCIGFVFIRVRTGVLGPKTCYLKDTCHELMYYPYIDVYLKDDQSKSPREIQYKLFVSAKMALFIVYFHT